MYTTYIRDNNSSIVTLLSCCTLLHSALMGIPLISHYHLVVSLNFVKIALYTHSAFTAIYPQPTLFSPFCRIKFLKNCISSPFCLFKSMKNCTVHSAFMDLPLPPNLLSVSLNGMLMRSHGVRTVWLRLEYHNNSGL